MALRAYLDTSVVLSLLGHDTLSDRARRFSARIGLVAMLSDLAEAEFAAVIAKRHRTGELSQAAATALMDSFDRWRLRVVQPVYLGQANTAHATRALRRLDLALRAPDALHLAIAFRLGVPVATFDRGMAKAAGLLGMALVDVRASRRSPVMHGPTR